MSKCALKGRNRGSQGEPSILLDRINNHYSGLKRDDGGNSVYDFIQSDNFKLRWGGDYAYKEPNEEGYEEFQRVENLYANKTSLSYDENGEPRFYIGDGINPYVLNYKGEKIFLNEIVVKEQDRLDITNAIFMSLMNDKLNYIYNDLESKDRTYKRIVKHFFNNRIESLKTSIKDIDRDLENIDDLTDDEIDELMETKVPLTTRLKTLEAMLNSKAIINSIEASLKQSLTGISVRYSTEENIDEQDENADLNLSFNDISLHTKESNEVRDTENIDSDILKLLSSVVDFTIDRYGNISDKHSELMGKDFVLGVSPNKVKNRILDNVANIIELELDKTGEFISTYDSMINRLRNKAETNNDELLNRFLVLLDTYTQDLSKQDLFAFQVKFFKAFSKSQQNFILTEMNDITNTYFDPQKGKSVTTKSGVKITYLNPADIQSKSNVLGKELFLNATEKFKAYRTSNSDYLTENDKSTINKMVQHRLKALSSPEDLQKYFEYRGIILSTEASKFLVLHKDDLGKVLNLTNQKYTLKDLLDQYSKNESNDGISYTYRDNKGKDQQVTRSYYDAIEQYDTLDKNEQVELLKAMTNTRFDRVFTVLGSVEAIFKPDVMDSSFNIAGKSRWKYSLMGGINKEILRWKSGNIDRLKSVEHKRIPYVDYLLANRNSDIDIIKNYADDFNINLEQAKDIISKQRIETVEPVVFSQMRNNDDIAEFKSIGEGDLHMDHMFKLMNFNDEIYEFYDKNYQGANKTAINNFIAKVGKGISPLTNNADKGSALGIKGLTDPTNLYEQEVAGLIDEDGILKLDANAKLIFKNLLIGEIHSAVKHQDLIQEFYNIDPNNTKQRSEYLMNKLIPEVHYASTYTINVLDQNNEVVKHKSGENKTKTYKFKPELENRVIYKKDNDGNIIVETGILYTGFVNKGNWNKLGVFNSVLINNKDEFNKITDNKTVINPTPIIEISDSFTDQLVETTEDEMLNDEPVYNVSNSDSDNLVLFSNHYENRFVEDATDNQIDLNEILYSAIEESLDYNYNYISNLPGSNMSTLETNITNSNTELGIKQYALLSLLNEISMMNMFNGELMFFKQAKNSETLSLEDFLKRGPAPTTDGLQINIVDKDLYIGDKIFNSAKEGRKDNYIDYNGNQVSIDRNKEMAFAVITNLDINKSKYAKQISDGLGYSIKYGHEIADAGAYMTLGFYKRIMLQTQGWNSNSERIFQELQDPNTVMTDEHYSWLKQSGNSLQPVKLVGYDFLKVSSNNSLNSIDVPVFLKFAPAILTPSIARGLNLENLLEKMDNDGIDLIVSKSGSKVANQALTTVHSTDSNGNYNGLLNSNEMKLNPNKFSLSNLKWQVELPTHFFDDGNIGTQHMKNLLANLDLDSEDKAYFYKDNMITAKQVFDIYTDAVKGILKHQFNTFKSDLGIEILDGNNINYKDDKLREFLIRELDPAEDFHIISLLRNSNNPIETIPGIAQRMFPVLSGYIKKNVGKVNTNTGSVIQVANIGYDKFNFSKNKSDILFLGNDIELTPPKPITILDLNKADIEKVEGLTDKELEDLRKFDSLNNTKNFNQNDQNTLDKLKEQYKSKYVYYEEIEGVVKASVVKTDTNKMKINNAKLLLPFADIQKKLGISWEEFKELVDNDRRQNWSTGNGKSFDKRIVENIISYRIPNQSISSNDRVTVAGILPPNQGDQAIVYHEITAKAGSDFDVDKLYLMLPSYNIDKKTKRVYYTEKGLGGYQNQLIEAMGSILSSEKTFDDLMSPLDSNIVKDSMYDVKFDYFKQSSPNSDISTVKDYKKSLVVNPLTMLTPAYKVKNRVDMTKAKQLVATMANHMTHVPFSQLQKIELESNLGFGNVALNSVYVTGFEGDNEMKITKMVSYFMNAAVDAAKDNYIIEGNFNSYTANAAMVLIRSGIHPEQVFKLLLHPEILNISTIKQADTEINTDIKLAKEGLDRDTEDILIKKYQEYLTNNPIETTNFEEFLNSINNDTDLLKGYWFSLVEMGKQLADDIAVSKPEAKGAGKNIYEHISLLNKLNQVKKGNIGRYIDGDFKTLNHLYVNGVSKVEADNFTFDFIDPSNAENDAIINEYTMFGMIMNNTLLLTNLMSKNLFIEASDNYVYMINKLSELSGNILDTSSENIKNLSKMLYPIVLSSANHELYNMTYQEQQAVVNTVNTMLKELKSIGILKTNSFLDLLQYNEKTNLVEFPGYKQLDARDKNQIRHDFKKLYDAPYLNGYKSIIPDNNFLSNLERFTKYLIAYSYISTGFKKSRSSFEEYLPATYFGETNHGLAVENLLNVLNNNSKNNQEFIDMMDNSLALLAYSNPKNYRFVKDFKGEYPGVTSGLAVNSERTLKLLTNKRTGKYYPFITYTVSGVRNVMKLTSIEEKLIPTDSGVGKFNVPIYESMLTSKPIIESSEHNYLYTGLFKNKAIDQTKPMYLKEKSEIPYFDLVTLLTDNNTTYKSRLDSLSSEEFLDNIPDLLGSTLNQEVEIDNFETLKDLTMNDISALNDEKLELELEKVSNLAELNEFIKKYCR